MKNEDTNTQALNIFNTKLNLVFTSTDIGRSHRVGKPKDDVAADTSKPRPIIVRLVRHDTKDAIIKSRKQLKSTGIVIVEDLTKARRDLLWRARNIDGVSSVWSTDGRLYVKKWATPGEYSSGIISRIYGPKDLDRITAIKRPAS